ncbi:MAG: hypothetical protein RLZZ628_89 [Bacteroidota bacterium]|jgi:polyphosphate kinase 2 (PPK2 family)
MISSKDLANMSVEALAQAIETHQQELAQLYQAMSAKISKQTIGEAYLGDDKVIVAEYWLKVAKDYRNILAADYNVNDFEAATTFFKAAADVTAQHGSNAVLLKDARDAASKDCAWHISHVRKRVKELEYNPIFKLVLQREPNPRQYNLKMSAATPVKNA